MRIHFLGTGAAEGIPAMGCDCDHCLRALREGGRLVRQRSAVLFSLPGYELLMDTPPDIRQLLETYGIRKVDGVFLTHEHFDHVGGLDELLYWRADVDLFAAPETYGRLVWQEEGRLAEKAFYMAFRPGVAIRFDHFFVTPFQVEHDVPCFGLAIYLDSLRVIHAADTSARLSNYARCVLQGADILIVNTPFFEPRPDQTHLSVQEAVALKEQLDIGRLILTHANHFNRPHDELEAYAARFDNVTVAYDGLVVEI